MLLEHIQNAETRKGLQVKRETTSTMCRGS